MCVYKDMYTLYTHIHSTTDSPLAGKCETCEVKIHNRKIIYGFVIEQ